MSDNSNSRKFQIPIWVIRILLFLADIVSWLIMMVVFGLVFGLTTIFLLPEMLFLGEKWAQISTMIVAVIAGLIVAFLVDMLVSAIYALILLGLMLLGFVPEDLPDQLEDK